MGDYRFLGSTVSLTEPEERVFEMVLFWEKTVEEAKRDFAGWYQVCGSIGAVLGGYSREIAELTEGRIYRPLYDQLVHNEVYDVSEATYLGRCVDLSAACDAYDLVMEWWLAVERSGYDADEYRRRAAEERAKRLTQDGRFGFKTPWNGITASGTQHPLSGLSRKTEDALENARHALESAESAEDIYSSSEAFGILSSALEVTIWEFMARHMNLMNEIFPGYFVCEFDADRSGAYFVNARCLKEKEQNLLTDSFRTLPWNPELLRYAFVNYPENRKETVEICRRFRVPILPTAEQVIAGEYTDEARASEEAALQAKQKILRIMEECGIRENATLDRLEQDCLTRLCSGRDLSFGSEERSRVLEEVRNYDARDRNKAFVVFHSRLWELARDYDVKFDSTAAEELIAAEYRDSDRISEEKALQAKSRMKKIMEALEVKDSPALDLLERDCLDRLCAGRDLSDSGERARVIEDIRNYDALDHNKAGEVYAKQLWELAPVYGVKFDGATAENLIAAEYTAEAAASEAAAREARGRMLRIMEALGVENSPALDRLERDCLERLCAGKDLAAGSADRIALLREVRDYDAQDKIKQDVIYVHCLWELSREYDVRFSPETAESIIAAEYPEEARSSEEAARRSKERIAKIMEILGVTDSPTLDRLETDCLGRLCGDIDSAGEEVCCRNLKEIGSYDALEKNKAPFIRHIQDRINYIWYAEDFTKFAQLYMNTPPWDLNIIRQNQAIVAETGRTADKQNFILAFAALNEENVLIAAKYAVAKEKGGFSRAMNVMKENIYNTLTCGGRILHPAIAQAVEQLKENRGKGRSARAPQPAAPVSSRPAASVQPQGRRFCTKCGAPLHPGAKFCTRCGAKQG